MEYHKNNMQVIKQAYKHQAHESQLQYDPTNNLILSEWSQNNANIFGEQCNVDEYSQQIYSTENDSS